MSASDWHLLGLKQKWRWGQWFATTDGPYLWVLTYVITFVKLIVRQAHSINIYLFSLFPDGCIFVCSTANMMWVSQITFVTALHRALCPILVVIFSVIWISSIMLSVSQWQNFWVHSFWSKYASKHKMGPKENSICTALNQKKKELYCLEL